MENGPTVFLVSDEAAFAERFEAVVSGEWRVRRADRSPTAVEAVDDVDALVLDGRGGCAAAGTLLGAVRERGYDGRVVALLDDEPGSMEARLDGYLVGPVEATDLRDAIEELLPPETPGVGATVFEALGDATARRCCRLLLEEPRSANELAQATGYSVATVYRRLDALQAAGLVEATTRIRDDGGTHEVYRTVTTAIRVDLEGGFRVDLEREPDEPRP